MQTKTPAENLLQRLLQSDKFRNTYTLVLEDHDGCTRISLRYSLLPKHQAAADPHQKMFLLHDKKFFN